MNQPRGLGPDRHWTVECERCEESFAGITEGDTGQGYLLDEDNAPQERPCAICDNTTGLCRECVEDMVAPLCRDCDTQEFTTSEVAAILGLSLRHTQHLGKTLLGKVNHPRYKEFVWTPAEIREVAARNTKRGPKRLTEARREAL